MIFISDGDIIKNQIYKDEIYPLGKDKWTFNYTGVEYGNKKFILNCIDYLMDETDLINTRSKIIKLRLLNPKKINQDAFFWKLINTIFPIILIIIFAIIQIKIRKHKYESKQ